jgi:hypothetical protein
MVALRRQLDLAHRRAEIAKLERELEERRSSLRARLAEHD